MKKIRCFLMSVALGAALSGLSLQGMGSMANAASSRYVSSISAPFVVGKSTRSEAFGSIKPPCGVPGTNDC